MGCGDELFEQGASVPLERDSAGVQIVENEWDANAQFPLWSVDEAPNLRIGLVNGDPAYLLNRVGAVIHLPDGQIAVVNDRTEVRFYDQDGVHLRTVGGSGDGPGEFRYIAGITFARDTLFVFDERRNRVTFFEADGFRIGSTPTLGDFGHLSDGVPKLAAAPASGGFVFLHRGFIPPRRDSLGIVWSEQPNIVISRDGEAVDTVGVTAMEWMVGNDQVIVPPFGRRTSTYSAGESLVLSHGKSFEVEVHDLETGSLRRLIRLRREPVRISAREAEEALDGFLDREVEAQLGGPSSRAAEHREALRPLVEALEFDRPKTTWSEVFIDTEGFVWTKDGSRAESGQDEYTVFDAAGRLAARAQLPPGLRIEHIGFDHLIAVDRDDLGVQSVVLFELRGR